MTEYLMANIGGIVSIALHSHNTLTWSVKLEVETLAPHGVEFGYQNINTFDSSFEDERVGFSFFKVWTSPQLIETQTKIIHRLEIFQQLQTISYHPT